MKSNPSRTITSTTHSTWYSSSPVRRDSGSATLGRLLLMLALRMTDSHNTDNPGYLEADGACFCRLAAGLIDFCATRRLHCPAQGRAGAKCRHVDLPFRRIGRILPLLGTLRREAWSVRIKLCDGSPTRWHYQPHWCLAKASLTCVACRTASHTGDDHHSHPAPFALAHFAHAYRSHDVRLDLAALRRPLRTRPNPRQSLRLI